MRKSLWLVFLAVLLSACSVLSPQPTQAALVIEEKSTLPETCPTCAAVSTCAASPTPLKATNTPAPSATATFTATTRPSATPAATALPMPYQVQPGTPSYLQNFAHPEASCTWMGLAGQVFDKAGKPLSNLVVVVEGTLNGKPVDALGLTGTALAYGEGGFEIKLADTLLASTQTLRVTVYDLAGKALTTAVPFNTQADCKKNLVLINFVQR